MELFDYQKKAVDFVKEKQKVYLALDMGLGKTLASIASMVSASEENILVIAEKTEVVNNQNFKKEVNKWFPDWEFFNLRETPIEEVPEKKCVCIINSDGVDKVAL